MKTAIQLSSPRERFRYIRELGDGPLGCNNAGIFIVRDSFTNETFVEKRLRKKAIASGHAVREINVLRQLSGHPNILRLVEFELIDSSSIPEHLHTAMIWTELCNQKSLHDFVNYNLGFPERIPERFLRHVLKSLAEAIRYCHQGPVGSEDGSWSPVYHRDVTLRNVFLSSESSADAPGMPRVVLGDFGLAITKEYIDPEDSFDCEYGDDGHIMASPFESFFAAPEFPFYQAKSDVYQIGAVMYCLMYKVVQPYEEDAPLLSDNQVGTLDIDVWDREKIHKQRYSDGITEMVSGCLVSDARFRCDVDMLLNRLKIL